MSDNKLDVLNNVIKGIEKQYGKGSIMILGEETRRHTRNPKRSDEP